MSNVAMIKEAPAESVSIVRLAPRYLHAPGDYGQMTKHGNPDAGRFIQ